MTNQVLEKNLQTFQTEFDRISKIKKTRQKTLSDLKLRMPQRHHPSKQTIGQAE